MNRFGSLFKPLMWFMALLLAAFVAGCGGGGDSGPAPLVAPIGIVAGDWLIDETDVTADNPNCMAPTNPPTDYTMTVTQTGNDLTVSDGANTFPGTISGDHVTWSGSFPEFNGTTTFNSVNVTVAADCNSISGTTNWTYVEPTLTCTGTTTFTGTDPTASGCGA